MSDGNIGFVVKTFPKLSETFILGEVLGLERMGLGLEIFALQRPGDAIQHDEVRKVRARVSYLGEDSPDNPRRALADHAAILLRHPLRYLCAVACALVRERPSGWRSFARALTLAHRVRRSGIRHLHAHFASEPAGVAQLAARLAGITYSVSAHAKDIYTAPRAALRRRLGGASFTVTCTECNRAYLAALAGPRAAVHRMYHGIDLERFSPAAAPRATPPLVLSVGRLRAKKGFGTLVRACALLRGRGVAFRCEIVGYGEERAALERLIAELRLAGRVALAGTMNHERLIGRYREATLFALPCEITEDGDRDGVPNVLLEAMATELPVVASAVSGIPEVVTDGDTGLLVPPRNAVALADALQALLENAELRSRLGASARRAVAAQFRNEENLKLVHGLLSRAAADPASGARGSREQLSCAGT